MRRHVVFFTLGFLFLHHVICTILYNAPVNPVTSSYQRYVANYMEPFFTQKWLLFAPEPATSDLKLWYKIKYNGIWTSWLDPLEPILEKHQHLRFTYNAKLLYVYSNIPKELSIRNEVVNTLIKCPENDSACILSKNDSLILSPEFKMAKRYVKEDVLSNAGYSPNALDSIQIMVIQLYPKQFSERLSTKPFGFANSTEFPPVKFYDKIKD